MNIETILVIVACALVLVVLFAVFRVVFLKGQIKTLRDYKVVQAHLDRFRAHTRNPNEHSWDILTNAALWMEEHIVYAPELRSQMVTELINFLVALVQIELKKGEYSTVLSQLEKLRLTLGRESTRKLMVVDEHTQLFSSVKKEFGQAICDWLVSMASYDDFNEIADRFMLVANQATFEGPHTFADLVFMLLGNKEYVIKASHIVFERDLQVAQKARDLVTLDAMRSRSYYLSQDQQRQLKEVRVRVARELAEHYSLSPEDIQRASLAQKIANEV